MLELAARIVSGDVRAVARACRLIDEEADEARALVRDLFPHTGRARVIGVTGAPGTGKSTLGDRLIELLRARGERVGVIAIDPSSPFSGGALLGDRIRMQRHAADPEVFVRSFGTRGARGGLSRSTLDSVHVLDAWGAHTILLETVGVGQVELDVLGVADTIVVVVIPGMGDDIQANKAGILEIADVFALNKADRPGADAAQRELEIALSLREPSALAVGVHGAARAPASDAPRVVRTVATTGAGVADLLAAVDAHGRWLESTVGRERREQRRRASAVRYLSETVSAAVLREVAPRLQELAAQVTAGALDPYTASARLIAEFVARHSADPDVKSS